MTKRVRKALSVLIVLLILCIGYFLGASTMGLPAWVSSGFATKVSLRFHYGYENKAIAIDTVITNPDDARALKRILSGWTIVEDGPSCGFDTDVSITMTDGRKSIAFCPACDGCGSFRIGKTSRYLLASDAQMKRFLRIVSKYGMTFPCV